MGRCTFAPARHPRGYPPGSPGPPRTTTVGPRSRALRAPVRRRGWHRARAPRSTTARMR